ncbi:MAG: hypothetical protein HYZ26_06065 [Chloroflexi bacterium]|nr:hypothetical protein [Chloroflexota bacterium]
MYRKIAQITLLSLVLALVVSACGGGGEPSAQPPAVDAPTSEPAAPPAPPSGGDTQPAVAEMTTVVPADARLDPALATEADAGVLEASRYVYDRLVESQGGQIVPGLASEWLISEDGLTYEITLRANASFADGTPVSTDVVMANFNRWYDPTHPLHGPDSSIYQAWVQYFVGFRNEFDENEKPISLFDGIEKVDDLHFLLHLNVPMPNFLEILALPQFSILNPAVLASEGAAYGTQGGSVDGSGAYSVESWGADGLLLAPNPLYWGPAAAQQVHFPGQ